jgi:hypothetical protein
MESLLNQRLSLLLAIIVQPFRSLRKSSQAGLWLVVCLASWWTPLGAAERSIDLPKAQARGIRVLNGKHLELLTDVPANPTIDEFPALFDAAVPEWAAFFDIPPAETRGWRARVFLMRDRAVFAAAGVLPEDLPEFPNGYTYNGECYLFEQTGDYYRRHLFLHEGTHAFQFYVAKLHSDQWYTEGVAEYLGLHEWKDGKLKLGLMPTAVDQVPKWGRIEYLQQAIRRGETLTFAQLRNLQGPSYANTVSYAWSWAAIAVMEHHPQYRERARKFRTAARETNFRDAWQKLFAADQADLRDDIAIYAHGAEYGYDWERNRVEFRAGRSFPADRREGRCAVDSARGWQASGIQLTGGEVYEIRATGQVLLQQKPEPWPAEANGITLAYHAGQPLGILLGAIRDDVFDPDQVVGVHPLTTSKTSIPIAQPLPKPLSPVAKLAAKTGKPELVESEARFMAPLVIGSGCKFRAPRTGTLYLRLNDSPALLQDNQGSLQVTISKAE